MSGCPTLHRGSASCSGHHGGAFLEERRRAVGECERGIARGDVVGAQDLVADAARVHRRRVVADRDDGAVGEEIEAAGHGHEGLARGVLEIGPVVVGVEGEVDVCGGVIAVAQDPAGVVRGAALVAELELLEPDDREPATCCVPRGGGAQRSESDDREVVGLTHRRPPLQ